MSKHKSHDSHEGGVNLGIIITPMLDMAFQLMAFFIMTYHPSALEGHIDGNLLPPTLAAVKVKDKKPVEPTDAPVIDIDPELTEVLMVQIKAVAKGQEKNEGRNEGEPKQLLLRLPQDSEAKEIANATISFPDGLKRLSGELGKHLKSNSVGKANIKLEADNNLKHQYTMEVYDVCKKAGFHNISFVAPPPERAPK